MIKMVDDNEEAFLEALRIDLGKPLVEGFITDIAFVASEITPSARTARGRLGYCGKLGVRLFQHMKPVLIRKFI